MKKRITSIFMIAVMAALMLGTTGCGSSSDSGSGEYIMKISNQWADSSVHSQMFYQVLIPEIEEKSGGRITCEFYGNNALGNEMDQLTQLQVGSLSMAILSDQSSSIDPGNMQLPLLPFLFDSEEQWDEVFQGEIGQQIVANMPEKGIRCLGFDENGYREITTTKKPINSAADMKGLKMRVTSSDIYINTFSSLGCSCQAMTLGEAYSALETGACDGQDNAYNTILSSNIYEVQGYLANTNHILGTMYLCVSEKWYQSLPDDLKQVVEEAAKDACDWQVKTYREQAESDHQALLDAGLQETYPDIDSFKEATQPVYDKFISQYPETEEIINSIKALAK